MQFLLYLACLLLFNIMCNFLNELQKFKVTVSENNSIISLVHYY